MSTQLPKFYKNLSIATILSFFFMGLGQIWEIGSKNDIFSSPMHFYKLLLLNSIPYPDPRKKKKKSPSHR